MANTKGIFGLLLCVQKKVYFFARRLLFLSKRLGVIGIVIDDPRTIVGKVNHLLSDYGHLVIGRMGIPRPEANVGVIALIIEGSTDEVGALTGKLGNLPGVTVKSALTTKTTQEENNHDK
jgi:putative iron-only hydrogenase system regulator